MFVLRFTHNAGGPKPATPGFFSFGLIGTNAVDTAASHRKSPAVTPRMPACKSVDRSYGKTGGRLFLSPTKAIHTMYHDITPYRERTLTKRQTIPARVREFQYRIIHGELITRRKLLASRLEAPLAKISVPSQ